MMDKSGKHDFSIFNKIVERPVDILFKGMECFIIISYDNLIVTNSLDKDSWNKFLDDSFNLYFEQSDNISDFLKHCVYYTCLAGRFYKMNYFLSLDDALYLIKDRIPNADTSFKTWHQLHKLARLVLLKKCNESSCGASLFLDLHTRTDGVCVDSHDNENIFNPVYLPNEEERVLVFHITVRYNSYYDKSLLISSRNRSYISSDFNHNSIIDQREVSKESKSAISPKQSDSFLKSFHDSNETRHWEKYGARPKNKLYFQKNKSDATASIKELQKFDSSDNVVENPKKRKYSFQNLDSTLPYLRKSSDFKHKNEIIGEVEENSLNEACCKYQDLPLPSSSTVPLLEKCSIAKERNVKESVTTRRFEDSKDSSPPSCSGMTEQADAPFSEKDYFRRLIDTNSTHKQSPIKSDSFCSDPFIPLTLEDNSYDKCGTRLKDKKCCFKKCSCKVFGNETESKPPDYFEKDVGAAEPADHDLISPQYFANDEELGGELLATEEQLEKMLKDVREFERKYEEAVLYLVKSKYQDEFSIYDSSDIERQTRSLGKEQYTSAVQRDTPLKMPFICFMHDRGVDDKLFYTMNAVVEEGLAARFQMLNYYIKTFFENYKIPDETLEDNWSLGTSMTNDAVKEYHNNLKQAFYAADSELERIPYIDTKNSENVKIADASNQMSALNFGVNYEHFASGIFENRMPFNCEHFSNKRPLSMDNPRPMFCKEISTEKTENISESNKVLTIDGKPIALATNVGDDAFFETFVQTLTESPSKSPQRCGSLDSSIYKKQLSPDKNSSCSDISKLVHLEKSDGEIKSQDSPKDEFLFDLCDESVELSDYSPESDSAVNDD